MCTFCNFLLEISDNKLHPFPVNFPRESMEILKKSRQWATMPLPTVRLQTSRYETSSIIPVSQINEERLVICKQPEMHYNEQNGDLLYMQSI